MRTSRVLLSAGMVACGLIVAGAVAESPKPAGKPKSDHQNYTETVTGSDGSKVSFTMIAVPGGEFLMGSPESEEGRAKDEGPQFKARLKPYWIGKCEVSWDEFDLYFRLNNDSLKGGSDGDTEKKDEPKKEVAKKDGKPSNPADAVSKPTKPYVDETYNHEREKHPAICMTHHAAMKYCEWLSLMTGKQYRLPTEAEWEYACRAGTNTPYGIPAGANIDDYAWYKKNSPDETRPRGTTHELGSKKPNAWGIHDMHGNVMEWCIDHHLPDAYARFGKLAVDGFTLFPVVKPTENKWAHVTRGGHFKDELKDLRSAARRRSDRKWMKHDPQEPQSIWWLTNYDMVGFRVCRAVEDDELKGLRSKVVRENDETYEP